ncbi:SH3 domain-containing protein [Cystobacter fuscus]|uniref:SH3 domain-containing protein n=1 Tax=Cystobacter fuscus TaxID=43 RepID=UPI002B2E9024|nr:SH3 domain-containing protein [Cystobacter fuscus]
MRPQRLSFWLALVGLSLGGPALAAEQPVRTLYVKAKNTHLKASGSPTADTLRVLQPGQPVSYLGREGTTSWHRVSVAADQGPLQGFIYQANLSSSPPALEVLSKDPQKPLSPEAFASSGAAIKAIGPGTIEFGKTLEHSESVQQLIRLSELASQIQDADVAAYARAGGLPEVVGEGGVTPPRPVKAQNKKRKGKK